MRCVLLLEKLVFAILVGIFVLSNGGHCLRFRACWTALRLLTPAFLNQLLLPCRPGWSSAFCGSLLTFCSQWSLHHTYFVTTLAIHRQSTSVVPLHLPNLLRPLLFSVDFLSMSLNTSVRYFLFYVFSSYLPLTPYSNISIFRDILGYLDILDLWLDFYRAPQT